ncbi:hypothetical protein FNL56_01590 [Tardiphaga sp. vice304]|uniref:hypothetical protein n=1 Tax=unclassified Tardiphaga TaxID=2631404 RepID=UPI001164D5B1|nr:MULTISPECIES: hypothetical protein [unclassified Tardiphaga]QDM14801.1 hypothetical protein FNL53_01680 [Tardiphaga sp. vice278]QDM19908.1 hypothetical protein FIU28_01150 [Tardiphaga sp. vice154]QDM24982.1 hypothetical protein FNL56_01590 [Tardiphaga sp. vice304]
MVDDRPEPTGPLDPNRPRRAPSTIELPASEVTSATSGPTVSESADEPKMAPELPEETAAESIADPVSPEETALPSAKRPSVVLPAATGALTAALLLGGAWLAGWPGAPAPEPQDNSALDALAARVARIEARPAAPANAGTAPDSAQAARLDTLEKSLAALRSDLAAAKSQTAVAVAAVSELKSAAAGPAVDLSPITARLGAVERAAGALKTEIVEQSAKPADDRPLRRVVAASLLDSTVRQSEPYAAALAAAKPLADDAAALKPLDGFAATGVPNAAALGRELLALLPKLVPAAEPVSTGSIVDRLQAGAARLVRIERTDAVAGPDSAAIASRAAAAARRTDLAEARRELMTLPPADRATVQPWIDRVDARDLALATSRQFAADAMAALSKPAR